MNCYGGLTLYYPFKSLILFHFLISRISFVYFFFFSSRRRHTRFDCDWSSDVCSSDLTAGPKTDVSSSISMVSSDISFFKTACLPDRNLCTPERATVEEKTPGRYH